jgi:DNA-binding NarL/FixJ family response regulator
MEYPIKIVIADDHEIFRDGFNLMFKNIDEIKQVAEAANGKELIEIVRNSQPDVVVTDIQMPLMNGIEATTYITANFPAVKVIGLAMFNEISDVVDMLAAGAQGYLLKNADKSEVIDAILQVAKGSSYFCASTRDKISKIFSLRISNDAGKKEVDLFSAKEIEIIKLICQEYSSKQIAAFVGLSDRTIDWYRDRIMEKMNVKTLAGIIVYAIQYKIFDFDE